MPDLGSSPQFSASEAGTARIVAVGASVPLLSLVIKKNVILFRFGEQHLPKLLLLRLTQHQFDDGKGNRWRPRQRAEVDQKNH